MRKNGINARCSCVSANVADLRPRVDAETKMEGEEWAKNLFTTDAIALYFLDFLFFAHSVLFRFFRVFV